MVFLSLKTTFWIIPTYILIIVDLLSKIKLSKKGGIHMNSSKKILKGTTKLAKKAAERSAFLDTYGTTCIYFYQPKVPVALKNRKKLNDK